MVSDCLLPDLLTFSWLGGFLPALWGRGERADLGWNPPARRLPVSTLRWASPGGPVLRSPISAVPLCPPPPPSSCLTSPLPSSPSRSLLPTGRCQHTELPSCPCTHLKLLPVFVPAIFRAKWTVCQYSLCESSKRKNILGTKASRDVL